MRALHRGHFIGTCTGCTRAAVVTRPHALPCMMQWSSTSLHACRVGMAHLQLRCQGGALRRQSTAHVQNSITRFQQSLPLVLAHFQASLQVLTRIIFKSAGPLGTESLDSTLNNVKPWHLLHCTLSKQLKTCLCRCNAQLAGNPPVYPATDSAQVLPLLAPPRSLHCCSLEMR